jgi:hypothetical protein
LPDFVTQNFWLGAGVWIALFISDYTLTITCAKLYRAGVCHKIALEGSYEITPFFQRDIDALRIVSTRFILALLVTVAVLFSIWQLTSPDIRAMYALFLGALILSQLAIHVRHFRNLFLFRAAASEAVRGRIEYSRKTILRASATELLSFCALYSVLFAFTRSWFILGGALSCLSIALKHSRLARRYVPSAMPQDQSTSAASSK